MCLYKIFPGRYGTSLKIILYFAFWLSLSQVANYNILLTFSHKLKFFFFAFILHNAMLYRKLCNFSSSPFLISAKRSLSSIRRVTWCRGKVCKRCFRVVCSGSQKRRQSTSNVLFARYNHARAQNYRRS